MIPRSPAPAESTAVELGAFAVRLEFPEGAALEPIRPSRQRLRAPAPFSDEDGAGELLGRGHDLAHVAGLFAAPGTRAVVVHGAPGTGKSALLAALAGDARLRAAQPGGVIVATARLRTATDCALALYQRFVEDGPPRRTPSEREIGEALKACDALVVLDDAPVGFALSTLLALAPRARLLVAASEPLVTDGAANYPLGGLDEGDAALLAGDRLDPWSAASSRDAIRALCTALAGNPGRIRQLATHARTMGWPLRELAGHLRGPEDFDRTRLAEVASKLDAEQRSILEAAALFGEAAVCGGQAEDPAFPDLHALEELRLLDRAPGGLKLATGLAESLAIQLDDPKILDAAIEWFDERFAAYGELMANDLGRLADLADGVRRLAQLGRPAAVVRFGRPVSNALAARAQWRAWEETVSHVAVAADRLGDRSAQAWANHQIGVRALASGERNVARAALEQALEQREALRDEPGAELTRRQLALLDACPPNASRRRIVALAAGFALALAAGFGLGTVYGANAKATHAAQVPKAAQSVNAYRPPQSAPRPAARSASPAS